VCIHVPPCNLTREGVIVVYTPVFRARENTATAAAAISSGGEAGLQAVAVVQMSPELVQSAASTQVQQRDDS
jgi:hypothetical protein